VSVVAAVADLFFSARLEDRARRDGVRLTVAPTLEQLRAAIEQERPSVVLVDLSARGLDPIEAIRLAKAAGVGKVIAFGPHKDLVARTAAMAAGVSRWVTNQQLAQLDLRLLS
jgi:DNA-binding response OmpR family regulator